MNSKNYKFATIPEIISDAKEGKLFIITDDENRENEGDLVIPAQFADPKAINFMAKYGRGLICLSLTQDKVDKLQLPLMSPLNKSRHGTAFTISIEAKEGITTGISAADRSKTIKDTINPNCKAHDICSPGHIFPLVSRNGGVLTRAGHTEASVDISKLAGLNPSGVICEIMNEDGTMARLPDLIKFAQTHNLKIATIADIIKYRQNTENLITKKVESHINTKYGTFDIIIYVSKTEYAEHIVLKKGNINPSKETLVRMHSQEILTDMVGDIDAQHYSILTKSMELINKEGGLIVILRSPQKDRVSEILLNKDNKQKEKNIKDYGIGAQILKELGVKKIKLISNQPKSLIGLDSYGLEITKYVNI